jgi:hypothetical protein
MMLFYLPFILLEGFACQWNEQILSLFFVDTAIRPKPCDTEQFS